LRNMNPIWGSVGLKVGTNPVVLGPGPLGSG
jgi:hypothetical protein